MSEIELLWRADCQLGEGPVWDSDSQSLWFVDIKGKQLLHWFSADQYEVFTVPGEIGSVALCHGSERLLLAMDQGVAKLTPGQQVEIELVSHELAEPKSNRMNDGKCDPAGRFWFASMDDQCQQPSGSLWCMELDGTITKKEEGVIVGNGMGWSPDGSRMYFTDSENRIIYIYPYDLEQGLLGERETFAVVDQEAGVPDGLAVDAEGYIWSAHWDGWRITRYSPEGKVDRVVKMPVPRPTSVAFGGPDLDLLFVTSASHQLTEIQLAESPLSGSLFAFKPGVSGQPVMAYQGSC